MTLPPETPLPAEPAAPAPGEPRRTSLLRAVVEVMEALLAALILMALINFSTARMRVYGYSMEPTMHDGEYILVNKLAYAFSGPQAGDIIVFRFPRDPDEDYIKRVIGLPGDKVEIAGRQVRVNGILLDEPYIADPPRYESSWSVPEGMVFVLGDNRNNSSDSHEWGPVPLEYLIGKALLIYWPPAEWGLAPHAALTAAAQP